MQQGWHPAPGALLAVAGGASAQGGLGGSPGHPAKGPMASRGKSRPLQPGKRGQMRVGVNWEQLGWSHSPLPSK